MDRYPYDGKTAPGGNIRALITEPEFIIADELLSSLDVPTQVRDSSSAKRIMTKKTVDDDFISHDIPMVEHVCDRIVSTGTNKAT